MAAARLFTAPTSISVPEVVDCFEFELAPAFAATNFSNTEGFFGLEGPVSASGD